MSQLEWAVLSGGMLLTLLVVATMLWRRRNRAAPSTPRGAVAPGMTPAPTAAQRWLTGLARTRQLLQTLTHGQSPSRAGDLEAFHEQLYRADLGVEVADLVVARLAQMQTAHSPPPLATALAEILTTMVDLPCPELVVTARPRVSLIVGVNGVGKTTTLGKLAHRLQQEGERVLLVAADTYRAAAAEQLSTWAERAQCGIEAQPAGTDPAAVVFSGLRRARAEGFDRVLIDTAGRLHNKKDLMDQLAKISRVTSREHPGAPHDVWIVVDATTGQNALHQVSAFSEVCPLTGVIVSKLDGTAKGGVVFALAHKLKKPVVYVGLGEHADDLQPFSSASFVSAVLGLEPAPDPQPELGR